MTKIYIVMAKRRKGGDWLSLHAYSSLQNAENNVFKNQKDDEQNDACYWQYKILTCYLD